MGRVLHAARHHGLSVNAFLAAAARFTATYEDLSLTSFAYPDPTIPKPTQVIELERKAPIRKANSVPVKKLADFVISGRGQPIPYCAKSGFHERAR